MTHAQKRLLAGQRGSNVKGCSNKTPLWKGPSWLRDPCAHVEGSWDIPNIDCEPGKSKWLTKGNSEEVLHKSNSNCNEGTTQQLSHSLSPPVCLSTGTVLFFLLINTFYMLHYFVSLWKFFSANLKCQGSCHWPCHCLVAKIWRFHCCELASVSG